MYVCVCNAVTENHIVQAVAEGCRSMRELRDRLGVGVQCGRCSSCARRVMGEAVLARSHTQEIHFTSTTS